MIARTRKYLMALWGVPALLTTACSSVHAETVFDEREVQAIVAQGPWPAVTPSDPGNELSGVPWAEALGESLFFDPTLSKNGLVSCGSCHKKDAAFADGVALAKGLGQGMVWLGRWGGQFMGSQFASIV